MNKSQAISLDALWKSAVITDKFFDPSSNIGLPPLAQRYLVHAITAGKRLASSVRLAMHGEIKLQQKWYPFKAEEVICWQRGMIWRATTWMNGLPIWGADWVIDGIGETQWKILGLFPVVQACGDDITRSIVGRAQIESIWLPSVLCTPDIAWIELNDSQLQATFTTLGEPAKLTLTVDDQGLLTQLNFRRWGNPDGGKFAYVDFGGIVEQSGTFDGYTIPTCLRIGWYCGSSRFAAEGEFFRCIIDQAIYH